MHRININALLLALDKTGVSYTADYELNVDKKLLDAKARLLLEDAYKKLNGTGLYILLSKLRFDFKIDRYLFVYDDAVHFNRYRLGTLKSELYHTFTYPWVASYERQCKLEERDCLQAGMQERVWYGPPIASKCFGASEEAGDLTGNGSAGWKLNAYNDLQYDLISRLHGYKLIRISAHDHIMMGGSLKKIQGLLLRPNDKTLEGIGNWLLRKMG